MGPLGGRLKGLWGSWGTLLALVGSFGRLGDLGWILRGSLGRLQASPGVPLGILGAALGGPRGGQGGHGGAFETNCCGKAAVQNHHFFYIVNAYIWALGGSLGDLGWDKFLTKTGEGEGNGDRGAQDKPVSKKVTANRAGPPPPGGLAGFWGGLGSLGGARVAVGDPRENVGDHFL
jgi:hypothetical protein